MPNAWAKGSPGKSAAPAPASKAPAGKMRYVPPPTNAGAPSTSTSPPPGSGKMKYVAPPTNAGEWSRPKKSAGSGTSQWQELAAKEDAQLKASKRIGRAEAKQSNSVAMSGNDRADIAAIKMDFDLWTKKDVTTALAWSRAEECRIPNKRVARGGRLHKLINILLNNCDYVNERLTREKRYQDACRDPAMATGLDLKKQFVAPLAKRVLNKVEEDEAQQAYKDDDPDSDDSEGMAM